MYFVKCRIQVVWIRGDSHLKPVPGQNVCQIIARHTGIELAIYKYMYDINWSVHMLFSMQESASHQSTVMVYTFFLLKFWFCLYIGFVFCF